MKKRSILLVVVILAAGGAFWAFRSRGGEKPLVLSGSIEARDVEVGSLFGGRVAKVPVAGPVPPPIIVVIPDISASSICCGQMK